MHAHVRARTQTITHTHTHAHIETRYTYITANGVVATFIFLSTLMQVLYLVLDHETLEAVSASVSFSISEAASSQSSLGV